MDWLTFAGLVLAVLTAGAAGALFPPGAWYKTLVKPAWTPPDWLFPVAWTVLYAAMAYAALRVTRAPMALAAPALAFWAAQIVLNALWSPVFFGLHRIGVAMAVLALLWLTLLVTLVLFLRADLIAGLLLVPYLVWVSYAGALNARIWQDNRKSAAA